ncbi:hypothetical protein MP638_003186 [Amoeboaphelidium occidentale]|nr:hypothetical protein MP638_003186 [Amoeboaphelidium occidentale]
MNNTKLQDGHDLVSVSVPGISHCASCKKRISWRFRGNALKCSRKISRFAFDRADHLIDCDICVHERCADELEYVVECSRRNNADVTLFTKEGSDSERELDDDISLASSNAEDPMESTVDYANSVSEEMSKKRNLFSIMRPWTPASIPTLVQRSSNTFLTLDTSVDVELVSPKENSSAGVLSKLDTKSSISLNDYNTKTEEQHTQTPTSPSFLKELIDLTAEKSNHLEKTQKPLMAPLNVFTTLPMNYSKFVARVGPMHWFHQKMDDIMKWKIPTETLLVLAVATLFCLNPNILVFVPHLICLYVVINNYYKRSKIIDARKFKKGHRKAVSEINIKRKASTLPDHVSYKDNMQFIQFTMGSYCDVYEEIIKLNAKVDWVNEKESMKILQILIASMVLLIVAHAYIPWNLVVLFGIYGAFAVNTALGLALKEFVLRIVERRTESLSTTLSKLFNQERANDLPEDAEPTEIVPEVFVETVENQRWWAGMGWLPHTLKNERPSWSNSLGTIASRPCQDIVDVSECIKNGLVYADKSAKNPIPSSLSGLQWVWAPESKWETVCGDANGVTDDQGWVYYDRSWKKVKNTKSSSQLLTRNRRWVRKAVLVESPSQ